MLPDADLEENAEGRQYHGEDDLQELHIILLPLNELVRKPERHRLLEAPAEVDLLVVKELDVEVHHQVLRDARREDVLPVDVRRLPVVFALRAGEIVLLRIHERLVDGQLAAETDLVPRHRRLELGVEDQAPVRAREGLLLVGHGVVDVAVHVLPDPRAEPRVPFALLLLDEDLRGAGALRECHRVEVPLVRDVARVVELRLDPRADVWIHPGPEREPQHRFEIDEIGRFDRLAPPVRFGVLIVRLPEEELQRVLVEELRAELLLGERIRVERPRDGARLAPRPVVAVIVLGEGEVRVDG